MDQTYMHDHGGPFRSIFDDLPALVCLLKPAGGVELANRRCMEFFGATLEQMATWELADVIHPDDLATVSAAWTRAVETGDPYEVEGRHRRADGIYRWLHMRAHPLPDAQGQVTLWYLVQTDIDDRKRAEDLLKGEKRLLEMVASNDPLPDVLTALCTLVEEAVSDCHCGMLFSDASGRTWSQAIGPTLPSGYRHAMKGRSSAGDAGPCGLAAASAQVVIVPDVGLDERWQRQGWSTLALGHGLQSCWSSPIVGRGNHVLGSLAIYRGEPGLPTPFQRDLIDKVAHIASIAVERAQHDAALKQSEAFLAQAQRISSTGGFSWHTVTDAMTWSDQVYRIFGLDPAVPATLEAMLARLHPEDLPSFSATLTRQRRDGGDFEHEHRLRLPDGSTRHLHVVARATQGPAGQLEYIAAVQDVTPRRISEEALGTLRSELAHMARITTLNTLTASIAHEVRQPLTGIITNASLSMRMLAADPPNIDGAREAALRTIRDGNRAADVITGLRALVDRKTVSNELVDLNDAAREVISLARTELQRSRVILRAELADDLPPVMSDRVQLQQVILNLLLNAADAMTGVEDRPRYVVITTGRDEGDHVRLTVRDVGVGFDPRQTERLFDPFYTTKSSGIGIGLSISRSIIESHQGRLWAVSNDGPGATFGFSIPPRPAHHAQMDPVSAG
ncbi:MULTISPECIES: PAS domain-containing protein [unclassified Lysobacter]